MYVMYYSHRIFEVLNKVPTPLQRGHLQYDLLLLYISSQSWCNSILHRKHFIHVYEELIALQQLKHDLFVILFIAFTMISWLFSRWLSMCYNT
jgi:hypothetical protein